jgi:ribosomal protein L11 methyltransferase
MKWAQITITTPQKASEVIANFLFEMESTGVEIRDRPPFATLFAYFPMNDLAEERVHKLRQFVDSLVDLGVEASQTEISLRSIEDDNWAEQWKSAFPPLRIGKRLLLAPTWVEINPDPSDILLRLDPGMAFGTGQHPTTRLSIELLEAVIKGGEIVADIGAGSGVLAIAAAKFGASRVDAVDVDASVIPIAQRNAALNGVDSMIRLFHGDGLKALSNRYHVIVANILTKVILPMIPDCPNYLEQGGRLILSGVSISEERQVEAQLEENGFQVVETRREESWAGILAMHKE